MRPTKKQDKEPTLGESAQRVLGKVAPGLDAEAWLSRASEMLVARPAATLAIAVGTGVIIGATIFNRIGRALMIGALGVAGEMILLRARRAFTEDAGDEQPA